MALKLIEPASALAVTLVDAKLHLRVDVSDEDALITAAIVAATQMAEQATGRALMPQTWELTLDEFPEALELTRVPVASVTSVKYADTNGTMQTMSPVLYALDDADDSGFAYIVPAYGTAWPSTRNQINAVAVRYVAGYADASAVPDSIKAWIKLMVGAMYVNRYAEVIGNGTLLSLGFADRLLDRYKLWRV